MGKLAYSGRLLREFVLFALRTKAYWIVPLILLLALLGLMVVAGQGATPYIYTLF